MKNLNSILGSRIREERTKKGWTIEQLAEKVDLSPSSMGLVERADRALSIEKLYKVASVLEVSIDSLLCDDFENQKVSTLAALLNDVGEAEFRSIVEIVKCIKLQFPKLK